MKIALIGDLQLVSPQDPNTEIHEKRKHFAEGWRSFKDIVAKVRNESPDLAICIGDLVDWYSDENRDFAIELLDQLNTPWEATPGNHDFSMYEWDEQNNSYIYHHNGERWEQADRGWKEKGVILDNRVIDVDGARLVLMNSAFSDVLPGTREWLLEAVTESTRNLLFTHVPIDIPEMREYILSIDPKRKLAKYLQSHAPWLFDECIKGKVSHIYSGHLHLPGEAQIFRTTMHMLGLSTKSFNKEYPGMGKIAIFSTDHPESIEII